MDVIGLVLLLLPAAVANMAPVLVAQIPFLAYPLDFGITVRGRPLFGSNKTVRGMVSGICAAIATAYVLSFFSSTVSTYALTDLDRPLLLGFLLGFGALVGDAIESAVKRQLDIAPGESWWFFDQTDWIVGALVCLAPIYIFSFSTYIGAIVLGGLLHPVVNLLGYGLGLKSSKF